MAERLNKFLSSAGLGSRRRADDWIAAGRIRVNGVTVREPGTRVEPGDRVEFDGRPVTAPPPEKRYYVLHKPRGYVCSNADPHAEKLARELIPDSGRLFSAGRLDKNSEGLLLFTNDGELVHALTHPRFELRKQYVVTTRAPLTEAGLERIRAGIRDRGELLRVLTVTELAPRKYRFELNEGKNREIRRLVAAVGGEVARLCRVALGDLRLEGLPVGGWRELTPTELAGLRRDCGLDRNFSR